MFFIIRFLLRFVFLVILVVGIIYFARFGRAQLASYDFSGIRENAIVRTVVESRIVNVAWQKTSEFTDRVAEKGKEVWSGVERKIKAAAFKAFKEAVDERVEKIGEELGVEEQ